MFEKSSNPALTKVKYASVSSLEGAMTLKGTINKSLTLLLLIIVSASVTWGMVQDGNSSAYGFIIGGAIVGFIISMITIFKPNIASITAPIYALAEGLFLGGLSAAVEGMSVISGEEGYAPGSSGIVFNAVALTFGIFLIMLLMYRNGTIKPTKKLTSIVVAGFGAIMLLYITSWIMSMFGSSIGFMHTNGTFGIILCLAVIGLGAFSLILDFKLIEDNVENNAPKYMEWYGAFSLMITLVMIYVYVLRLLAIFSGRD